MINQTLLVSGLMTGSRTKVKLGMLCVFLAGEANYSGDFSKIYTRNKVIAGFTL